MVNIKTFVFNPFMENTYVLYDRSGECIIIDAGCHEAPERAELEDFIEENHLNPVRLVNTHCHIDHVLGVAYLKDKFEIPFSIHRSEEKILKATPMQGTFFGIDPGRVAEPDHFLEDGDALSFGESSLMAIHVPGHSPGSLVLHFPEDGFLIAGDVLFSGSIGRTDLPGGDHETLIRSIHDKLLVLDNGTRVYPGHGQDTTIGLERDHNPFLR